MKIYYVWGRDLNKEEKTYETLPAFTKEEIRKAELDAQLDKAMWELEEYLDYTGMVYV